MANNHDDEAPPADNFEEDRDLTQETGLNVNEVNYVEVADEDDEMGDGDQEEGGGGEDDDGGGDVRTLILRLEKRVRRVEKKFANKMQAILDAVMLMREPANIRFPAKVPVNQQPAEPCDAGYSWGKESVKHSVDENTHLVTLKHYYKCASYPGCPRSKRMLRTQGQEEAVFVFEGTHTHGGS